MIHNSIKTILMCATVLFSAPYQAQAEVRNAPGRIAFITDGNGRQGRDSIGSTPLAMSILAAAKMQDKLVHLDYAGHIWGNYDMPQYYENRWSVFEAQKRFDFTRATLQNSVLESKEAFKSLTSEINKSTAANPLYILAAAPLATICASLEKANKANFEYVTVVTHKSFDQNYTNRGSCDLKKMKYKFSGIKTIEIPDQSANLKVNYDAFKWLDNDTNLKWLYSRFDKAGEDVANASDAGLVWYILTGDKAGTPEKINAYFKKVGFLTPTEPVKLKGVACYKNVLGDTSTGVTTTVSNTVDLKAAILASKGGETILLTAGSYAPLTLKDYVASAPVTIASADPKNPAVFNKISLTNVKNLTLAAINFMYVGPIKLLKVDATLDIISSENVSVLNAHFEGPNGQGTIQIWDQNPAPGAYRTIDMTGFGLGQGLTLLDSKKITIMDSTFYNLTVGSNVNYTVDSRMVGNTYKGISYDAMDFSGLTNFLVEDNYVGGMRTPPNLGHKDLIQMRWFSKRSENVTFRNNVLVADQPVVHGIFMGTKPGGDQNNIAEYHQNILIEKNQIISGHTHGIAVALADGLIVKDNIVLHDITLPRQTPTGTPLLEVGSKSLDVTITGNTAHVITALNLDTWKKTATPANWTVSDNKIETDSVVAPVLTKTPRCE